MFFLLIVAIKQIVRIACPQFSFGFIKLERFLKSGEALASLVTPTLMPSHIALTKQLELPNNMRTHVYSDSGLIYS